ncbi:MAG TPA: hypothetical protein VEA19_04370 [Actinomycetota bacterium]|nr:hypothetical protein [Actinomycetota bacterium]
MTGRRSPTWSPLGTVALASVLLLTAGRCSEGTSPAGGPSPAPGTRGTSATESPGLALPVVAGPRSEDVLDGMRLAAEELTTNGVPIHIERSPSLAEAMTGEEPLVFVVGDAEVIAQSRSAIEQAGKVVVLIGADLYTDRRLYRRVFQVSPPLLWQARILARYVAADRRHRRVRAVIGGPSAETQRVALREAFRDEGIRATGALPLQRVLGDPTAVGDAQSVVFLGEPSHVEELAIQLSNLADPPQLALSSHGLRASGDAVRPGTVAVYHYAWGGWAEPIPRVLDFRARFHARFGRLPSGLEQEGYDAVHALSRTLGEDGGADAILSELEKRHEQTYSSLPIVLGPDDHVFVDESQLGLFAANQAVTDEPWVSEPPYWRPLMRSFTFDGEKTNILDEDKAIFFPDWRPPRPSPRYHRSRFGIVTRYGRDPLH